MADKPSIRDFVNGQALSQPMAWYVTVIDDNGVRTDLKFPTTPRSETDKAITCAVRAMNAPDVSFVSFAKRLA